MWVRAGEKGVRRGLHWLTHAWFPHTVFKSEGCKTCIDLLNSIHDHFKKETDVLHTGFLCNWCVSLGGGYSLRWYIWFPPLSIIDLNVDITSQRDKPQKQSTITHLGVFKYHNLMSNYTAFIYIHIQFCVSFYLSIFELFLHMHLYLYYESSVCIWLFTLQLTLASLPLWLLISLSPSLSLSLHFLHFNWSKPMSALCSLDLL